MRIDPVRCIGCGDCVRDCPLSAVRIKDKKAVIDERCSACGACARVCEQQALIVEKVPVPGAVQCDACPIQCLIREGFMGACRRYENQAGSLTRTVPLHTFEAVRSIVGEGPELAVQRPLVTAIGAGTTYPDCKPAPGIVHGKQDGVDVVTVVTEAPLSYSSILVKVDTDIPLGKEGAAILIGKRPVGMVETEQYGSKMLHIGGVNRLTGKNGFAAARAIVDIANRKPVKLKIENGPRLEIRVGMPPVIDRMPAERMRVGCGSATLGLFAPLLQEAADEVVILDSHITGLMSEHAAGRFVGVKPSGIRMKFSGSTPGRYFGDHGAGWGGTSIVDPVQIVAAVDMKIARPGMTLLVTETTGRNAAMYRVDEKGELTPIPITEKARLALDAIAATCQPSLVSAVYTGGAGGSARAGVTRYPVKLTRAVHSGKAVLTVGGSPVFVMPGGGITFMVDVERVRSGSFYWTPTPATICPIEYTMRLSDYQAMGGHLEAMKPFSPVDPPPQSDEAVSGLRPRAKRR